MVRGAGSERAAAPGATRDKRILTVTLSSTFPDTGHSSLVEPRFLTIGTSSRGRILVVAHTEHNDTVRIISARRATRHERRFYEEG
ncbi:MAG: BrnT family toxin [Acidobacteria bacterium]|nr:BrnT family toxin [Acidobacteriota bacterium]